MTSPDDNTADDIWGVVIWCCHLVLSLGFAIWCCHLVLSSGVVINQEIMKSYITKDAAFELKLYFKKASTAVPVGLLTTVLNGWIRIRTFGTGPETNK
jgi:hypothetical protein